MLFSIIYRYLTCTEWKNYYGGKKTNKQVTDFKRLPFTCCRLEIV